VVVFAWSPSQGTYACSSVMCVVVKCCAENVANLPQWLTMNRLKGSSFSHSR
jgi:hypothetical protein